jgi:hypothetical protein
MNDVFTPAFIIGTLLSFTLGALTSWLFWRYLLFLKPKVQISPMILKGQSRKEPSKTVYRIKVINLSKRQAINIAVSASICTTSGTPGIDQRRVATRHLTLNFGDLPALGSKTRLGDIWGVAPFFIFWTDEDIEPFLTEGCRLVFSLSASDALSGTTVVQRIAYRKADIDVGDFCRSLDFEKAPLSIA